MNRYSTYGPTDLFHELESLRLEKGSLEMIIRDPNLRVGMDYSDVVAELNATMVSIHQVEALLKQYGFELDS